jgi:putative transposase
VPGYTENPDGTVTMDSSIVAALKKYREAPEFMNAGGYHKLKYYLRRDYNFYVNHKKLYRLCREHGLLLPKNKKKIKSNRKICTNRVVYKPNQVWEFDIKYGYVHGENRHYYILAFIDVFNRKLINYHVGLNCKAVDLKFTFDEALSSEDVGDTSELVIRSDNGPQMTSNMFRKYIDDNSLNHEFIPPGDCNKNAHVESFNSIIETEFLQVRYFEDFTDAYKQTVEFMEFYNERRIHGSLKMMSPNEFMQKYEKQEVQILDVFL